MEPITIIPRARFGELQVNAAFEESYRDELQITEHPVESGAAITDHAYKRAPEVTLKVGWSNATPEALIPVDIKDFPGGSMVGATYVHGIYSQLLELQSSRVPFDLITSLRLYRSMLLTSLAVTRDEKTGMAIDVTATCRQIIIVSTQATTLPPPASQRNPANTAATVDSGVKQPAPATPAPGGSFSPARW